MSNLKTLLELLETFKVEDVAHINVEGASSLFDHMVVCTARSSQHAKTVADKIQYHFKPEMAEIPKSDGKDFGSWVAVDLDDVVVHIMVAQERERYSLEELWQELKKRTDEAAD